MIDLQKITNGLSSFFFFFNGIIIYMNGFHTFFGVENLF